MITFDLVRREEWRVEQFPLESKIGKWQAQYLEALAAEQEREAAIGKLRDELRAAQRQLQNPAGATAQDLAHVPAQIAMLEPEIERQEQELSLVRRRRAMVDRERRVSLLDYRSAINQWNNQIDPEKADNALSPFRWMRLLRQLDATIEQFEMRPCVNGRPADAALATIEKGG